MMQISELSFQVEMHFYLQGLKTELHQKIESNENNLQDIVTLKQVCLRLDNITNSVRNSGTKAKRTGIQDAALFSSTKNNRKGKNTSDNRNKNYKPGTKEKVWWNTCNICSKQGYHGSKCPERKYTVYSGKYHPFMECPEFKKFKEGQQKKNSDKESTFMAATFFTKSIKDNDKDNDVRFIID